ncbi:murein biosynthesis integral membrane protein MurJ [Nocardioides marmorisolisilvae]|uniref:Murein biosynthesis integral membrane protein MurJ n=1 Tax=Nocardioides marmorisolisilvae TaxID=1542737 RepID=A0A3N0DIJ1_9ACTN|nr:lipid II flippase MurJ [Nocardioides marmorisolisilvae]RNL75504.1 murein biosynthesis integral membrane protein MurJ [Nocardioides marmorisolisilvae]
MTVEREARAGVRMALATTAARLTGYGRSILLVAALGNGLHADVFAIANTIPNLLVVLLGAGVVNAVLVPQLVRAHRSGDGPEYVNQVITLFGAVLLAATVAVTLAAPLVLRAFVTTALTRPELADQYRSAVALAFCCLPQIFFYGVFALLGQILNSRGVFGPMMWAPVLNNLVAIGVLATYLGTFGTSTTRCGGYSDGQVLLLGLGTTLGVVVQCAALVPYLRRAGIHYRPTLRLLSPRMRTTLRLGGWTIAVVLTNQVVYAGIVRLATSGTAGAGCAGGSAGTGYTIYSSAYLLIMAPHAVVTVSLMTASLPGLALLASSDDRHELAARLTSALRLVMLAIVPVSVLLALLSPSVADLVWGYGTGTGSSQLFAPTLACFAVALLFFTAHYVALRGLYALEANRVILGIQAVIGVVDLGLAVVLVGATDRALTAPALATAYAVAYAVGSALSWSALRRRLGVGSARPAAGTLTRIGLSAALAAIICLLAVRLTTGQWVLSPTSKADALLLTAAEVAVFGSVFLAAARTLRVPELRVLATALRRQ